MQRAARSEVVATHRMFLTRISNGEYNAAYELMSSQYKSTCTLDEFKGEIAGFESSPDISWETGWILGKKSKVWRTNGEGWTVGLVYEYVKEEQGWRFTGQGEYFTD
jgi:hypothetical protein